MCQRGKLWPVGAQRPVVPGTEEAWLTEVGGTQATQLADGSVSIGRDADNDLVIADDPRVSRHHAEVALRGGVWWVTDCGSRNGTFVNDEAVTTAGLRDGDQLRFGSRRFTFIVGPDHRSTVGDVAAPPPGTLSARERQIVALVAAGSTDVQIARALNIRLSTVHTHLDRIRDKTGRRRRADLTRLARDLGLRTPD